MKTFKMSVGCLAATACLSAFGYDAEFVPQAYHVSAALYDWGYVTNCTVKMSGKIAAGTNWVVLATGEMAELPPGLGSDPVDNVTFGEYAIGPRAITLHTGNSSDGKGASGVETLPRIDPVVGSVTGNWYYTISVCQSNTDGSGKPTRWFKVANPNGFVGDWMTGDAKAGFGLTAAAGETGVFHELNSSLRPFVYVQNASATAQIDNLKGGGALNVTGPGTVKIRNSARADQMLYVTAGKVTLSPFSAAEEKALFDKAYVRFDASDADTLLTEVGADGRTYVTNWLDARGNGVSASSYAATDARANVPFLNANAKSPTGIPLVDFGSQHESEVATYGPTNCVLAFPRTKLAREVFYAGQYSRQAVKNESPGVVGDSSSSSLISDEGRLFGGAANKGVVNGEIRRNTSRIAFSSSAYSAIQLHKFGVIGLSSTNSISLSMIGATQWSLYNPNGRSYVGGVRVGEVLVYTQELTRIERDYIANYLTRKWVDGGAGTDFAYADIRNGLALDVDEGSSACVADVRVTSGKSLVKGGEGTLTVGRLTPQGANVTLNGGTLNFAAPPTPSTTAPADGAYLWLDANKLAAGDLTLFNGTNFVTSWTDCRADVNLAAYPAEKAVRITEPPHLPTVCTATSGGLKAIDLGLASASNNAVVNFPSYSTNENFICSAFIVFRQKVLNNQRVIFGGPHSYWYRNSNGRLLGGNIQDAISSSALATVNGSPIDPIANYDILNQTNDFVVVGLNSATPMGLGAIGNAGSPLTGNFNGGNIEVGEVIAYPRELTEEERLQTEAYLMNRWLGDSHPRTGRQSLGTVTAANGAALALGGKGNVEVSAISGASLVKDGDGELEVKEMPIDENLTSISVEGGTLKLVAPTMDSVAQRALFHFSADDASTLTTYAGKDPAGNDVSYVSKWTDADGRNVYATRATSGYFSITNPVLRQVEMVAESGTTKPTLDFGGYTKIAPAKLGFVTNNASMNMNYRFTTVREVHVVWADNQAFRSGWVLSDGIGSSYDFNRPDCNFSGTTGAYVSPASGTITKASILSNAYVAVDGKAVAYDSVFPAGFHLLSIAPTSAVTACSFFNDRGYRSGGGYLSEAIAFDSTLSATVRDYVQKKMMHNWLGGADPVWTHPATLSELKVAAGASLVAPTLSFRAAKISGSGSMSVASVSGVTALTVDTISTTSPSMTWTSPVTFGDSLAVTVVPEIPKTASVSTYVLVKGVSSLPATVTLDSTVPTTRTATLGLVGDELRLTVRPRGVIFVIR